MGELLKTQTDYFIFLAGIGFISLGIVSYFISQKEKGEVFKLPWIYLGLFAITQGFEQLLEITYIFFENNDAFAFLKLAVMSLSYVFLFEYIRNGAAVNFRRKISRWIFLPPFLIVLLSVSAGLTIAKITAHIILGVVGSCLAGIISINFCDLFSNRKTALWGLGLFLGLNGMQEGLSLFTSVSFHELMEAILALMGFFASWYYLDMALAEEIHIEGIERRGRSRIFILTIITTIAIIFFGWVAVDKLGKYAENELRQNLISTALTAAAGINPHRVTQLKASPEDYFNNNFKRLRTQLMAFHDVNPDSRFINLFVAKKDKIVFLADAEPINSKEYSPPGQLYDNPSQELKKIFIDGKPFIEGPFTDSLGTWVSAHAAVKDPETNAVVAVLGVDVSAATWPQKVLAYRMFAISVILLLFIIIIVALTGIALQLSPGYPDLIVDGISDTVILMKVEAGPFFRFLKVNNTFLKLTGLTEKQVVGKRIEEVSHERAPYFLNNFKRAWEARTPVIYEENFGQFIFETKVSSVFDANGNCSHLIVMARDITERKRVEEALRESEEGRKQMEEELYKSRRIESVALLAGGIAHDFNNILTIILGNITLAKLKVKPEDQTYNKLTEIEKASIQAKDLTKQLLTFAKGGAPIRKTASIIELIKDTACFTLRGSNVKCEFTFQDHLWAVEIDEGQISQVISNLIINADQAMPEGGIINVSAQNITLGAKGSIPLEPGNYVKLCVEDQGTGISEEQLTRIFEPYFTTKAKGNGLGLATAYSIIKRHDGFITVKSKVGAGTNFSIYLPASEKEVSVHVDKEVSPLNGKGKVLVMDDEEAIRELVSNILNHYGYEVACARDGTEAIQSYFEAKKDGQPFDVIIMDLTIPGGMGGKEALTKLVEIDPHVKTIVSSGYSNDPIMAEYERYGFCGVVAKPYNTEELIRIVAKVIISN